MCPMTPPLFVSKRLIKRHVTMAITSIAAVTSGPLAMAAPAKCAISLARDIQPVLNANCVACHQDAAPGGSLSLQSRSFLRNTVNVPSTGLPRMMRIRPGSPQSSYLYLKLTGSHLRAGGAGVAMPLGSRLDNRSLGLIRDWIGKCKAAG